MASCTTIGEKVRIKNLMTVDLRPINAETKGDACPIPILETEFSDFADSRNFTAIDFCGPY